MSPAPKRGERCKGDTGARPSARGPILSLTYDYCCSNLKGGKIFDKLPFGYSSEEEHFSILTCWIFGLNEKLVFFEKRFNIPVDPLGNHPVTVFIRMEKIAFHGRISDNSA